ncbi:MAG: aldo/keto reductase [Desulfarculus sp.]|nr:aldo/keto reductase [Desulfarculus sp.]
MSDKEQSNPRRAFLKAVGLAGVGSLVAASGGLALAANEPPAPATGTMPQRTLGKTGAKVSMLSLGTMWDTPTNQIVLKQALKLGVTHWDTAESYEGGRSEEGIGQFFKKNPEARQQVFLVTKSYDNTRTAKVFDEHLNQSLKRMNTSYIDLWFVHSLTTLDEFNKPHIKAWAEKAKAEGKIKHFGFSTHKNMEDILRAAAKLNWVDVIMMTYNYRLMYNQKMKDAVQACFDAGIGLTAMKTMGGGPVKAGSDGDDTLAERFLAQGYSAEQAKLKAVWSDQRIANICSQMPNLAILSANTAAAMDKTQLAAEDLRWLGQYAEATRCDYCAGCSGICEEALGQAAPVGEILRAMMYYRSYGDLGRARELFAALPTEGLEGISTRDLARAERRCPQGLAIGRLLHEAQEALA